MLAILLLGNIAKWVIAGIILSVLAMIIFVVGLYFDTKDELRVHATDMFVCKTHGLFPQANALYLEFPQEDGHTIKVPTCSLCLKDSMTQYSKLLHQKDNKVLPWKGRSA